MVCPSRLISKFLLFTTALSDVVPEAPRWAGMVINLKRRDQRFERFEEAVNRDEPWLLQKGSTCRIPGRDGAQFSTAVNQVSMPEFENARSKAQNSSHWANAGQLPVVPESLADPVALLANGWLTEEAIIDAASAQEVWPKMTAGGVGLYFAHAAAWQHVVKLNLDYGVVFEDDLTLFSPRFEEEVSSILSARSQWWDLLYLQRCGDDAWPKKRVWQHVPGQKRVPQALHDSEVFVDPLEFGEMVPCTGAYVITREGAEKLLRGGLPANEQLDVQLGKVPNLRRAALSPPVAQCWEIYKNKRGLFHRDTDVQTVNGDEYEYWRKQNEMVEKWMNDWDERRRRDWAEEKMGRAFLAAHGRNVTNAMDLRATRLHVADCVPVAGK